MLTLLATEDIKNGLFSQVGLALLQTKETDNGEGKFIKCSES
jgi:hypothetical protein